MKTIYNLLIVSVLTMMNSFAQTELKPLNIALFLYEGVELLDFAGPYEVFGNTEGFNVYTVSYLPEVGVFPTNKIKIKPDYQLVDCPKPDIIVFPGATPEGIMRVYNNEDVMKWVKATNEQTQLTMSVCTGAYFLSKNEILDGKKVTTHHGAIDYLQKYTPKATVLRNTRFVEDGKIITTAGVSAGLDGALHIVEKLKGLKVAQKVASLMEYDHWKSGMGLVVGKEKNTSIKLQETDVKPKKVGKIQKPESKAIMLVLEEDCKDPVCKMPVLKGAKDVSIYKGKQIGFCSIVCKEMFDEKPEKYVHAGQ
jgi:transcriptional regulator GlxA family with amidase domain/YHS domain-containing protein